MSQREKLRQRIKNNPNNVSFDDLRKLLEAYGFTQRPQRSGSSHFWFFKEGCGLINVPYHRPVKQVYVRKVIQLLEDCGLIDED
jgi:predicted RNA binding protein YcfA (HicA-like mRNA interferase family)